VKSNTHPSPPPKTFSHPFQSSNRPNQAQLSTYQPMYREVNIYIYIYIHITTHKTSFSTPAFENPTRPRVHFLQSSNSNTDTDSLHTVPDTRPDFFKHDPTRHLSLTVRTLLCSALLCSALLCSALLCFLPLHILLSSEATLSSALC